MRQERPEASGKTESRLGSLRSGPLGMRSFGLLVGGQFTSTIGIALIPYLGGEAGAGAMLFISGATNGLGNVTVLTVVQKWAPPALLGRVMSVIMLCAFGSFPLSVAVSGVLIRHIGPSLFFPIAGAVVAAAILGGLTQREFREFGAAGPREPKGAALPREPKGAAMPGLPSASQRAPALPGLRSEERATREGGVLKGAQRRAENRASGKTERAGKQSERGGRASGKIER